MVHSYCPTLPVFCVLVPSNPVKVEVQTLDFALFEVLNLKITSTEGLESLQSWKSNCKAKVSNFVVLNCLSELNEVGLLHCQKPSARMWGTV